MRNKLFTLLLIVCALGVFAEKAPKREDFDAASLLLEAEAKKPQMKAPVQTEMRMPKPTAPPEGAEEVSANYPNGNLLVHGYTIKDKKVGYWYFFHPNTRIKAEGEMKDDLRSGFWVYYHDNGKRSSEGEFDEKGQATGEWKRYHKDGALSGTGSYVNGKEEGIWTQYGTNGYLAATISRIFSSSTFICP